MTPAYTLSSHDLYAADARASPNPAQRQQAAVYERFLQSDPPGWWAANRYEQTNHYTGVVAIAAKAYMDAIGAAKFTVLERKTPGLVGKSTSGAGNYSRDDEYEPVDPRSRANSWSPTLRSSPNGLVKLMPASVNSRLPRSVCAR